MAYDGVEAYGGEILFTPGDIVYSSSAIIEAEAPAIASVKSNAAFVNFIVILLASSCFSSAQP